MTTYNAGAVADAVIAFKKGITLQQGRALRDNPLAIAEMDSTVPAILAPTVLLGTLTTTSGASQTLSGLVLTPYKLLIISMVAVGSTSATSFNFGTSTLMTALMTGVGDTVSGIIIVDLANGRATGMTRETGATIGVVRTSTTGVTTATVSITFSPNAGTFDDGSILVYGCK